MRGRNRTFNFLIIIMCIVIFGLFVLSKINPSFNLTNEIVSGSVIGILLIVVGFLLAIAFIRMLVSYFRR